MMQAYQQVNTAFYEAIKGGKSLHNSTVYLRNLDITTSLANANALLTALVMGERGETSGRARTWRQEDMVETGVVLANEGEGIVQMHNAIDRITMMAYIGLMTAYRVKEEGCAGYEPGTIIMPGMGLPKETLTNAGCVPIMSLLPTSKSVFMDGTNIPEIGKRVTPEIGRYLSLRTAGNPNYEGRV